MEKKMETTTTGYTGTTIRMHELQRTKQHAALHILGILFFCGCGSRVEGAKSFQSDLPRTIVCPAFATLTLPQEEQMICLRFVFKFDELACNLQHLRRGRLGNVGRFLFSEVRFQAYM